jgi:hypothetical protein
MARRSSTEWHVLVEELRYDTDLCNLIAAQIHSVGARVMRVPETSR